MRFETENFYGAYHIGNGKGWFEHNELGDEYGGGLWFEGKELVDYDGIDGYLPTEVVEVFEHMGFDMGWGKPGAQEGDEYIEV